MDIVLVEDMNRVIDDTIYIAIPIPVHLLITIRVYLKNIVLSYDKFLFIQVPVVVRSSKYIESLPYLRRRIHYDRPRCDLMLITLY